MEMQDTPCFFLCASPEVFPLNEVTTPIMLINGAEDPLADTEDVNWLATQLKNVVYR
jgi:predicted alpha/beta-fold hydrolase